MKTIDFQHHDYPGALKQIPQPPQRLYYKGHWDNTLFSRCLGVVGSRRMSRYGKHVVDDLVGKAAAAGITIVSGFMYGVDAQAHRAALAAGGKTIAVMPCGINIVHPQHQNDLYDEILHKKGLIISEYEDKTHPMPWTYPERNRIVAGICQAVLIVEAAHKSGSLITANLAKSFNRILLSIPGPITSPTSQGALQLIKDGAKMVTCAQDIIAIYDVKPSTSHTKMYFSTKLTQREQRIITHLSHEPSDMSALARLLQTPVSQLGACLSFLQIKGLIVEENGKFYINITGN